MLEVLDPKTLERSQPANGTNRKTRYFPSCCIQQPCDVVNPWCSDPLPYDMYPTTYTRDPSRALTWSLSAIIFWCASREASSRTGAPRILMWVSSMPTPKQSPTTCMDESDFSLCIPVREMLCALRCFRNRDVCIRAFAHGCLKYIASPTRGLLISASHNGHENGKWVSAITLAELHLLHAVIYIGFLGVNALPLKTILLHELICTGSYPPGSLSFSGSAHELSEIMHPDSIAQT